MKLRGSWKHHITELPFDNVVHCLAFQALFIPQSLSRHACATNSARAILLGREARPMLSHRWNNISWFDLPTIKSCICQKYMISDPLRFRLTAQTLEKYKILITSITSTGPRMSWLATLTVYALDPILLGSAISKWILCTGLICSKTDRINTYHGFFHNSLLK